MRRCRHHAFGRGEEYHQIIGVEGARALLVEPAAGEIDDRFAAMDNGDAGAQLVALSEVLLERVADALPAVGAIAGDHRYRLEPSRNLSSLPF